jgi:phosphoribosylaminoimidazole-succinocarboxamide synthase
VNARPEPRELLYEGKAKQVFACDDADVVIVRFKDDATAFNAQKRGTVDDKGVVNNAVSAMLYAELEAFGVPTHFVEQLGARDQLVRRVTIVPVEVIVRNRAAGTFAQRYGVAEGLELDPTVVEWCYKSDPLGDPPMNTATAVALGPRRRGAARGDVRLRRRRQRLPRRSLRGGGPRVDRLQARVRHRRGRRTATGRRDQPRHLPAVGRETGEKLDKDRFRRDLGGVEEAYLEAQLREIAVRVLSNPVMEDVEFELSDAVPAGAA